ncbi:MAG TPA: effector-associated domain EAD1-containing protein, partial [Pirellulales bacterium]
MEIRGRLLGEIREALRGAFPADNGELAIVVEDAELGFDFSEHQGTYRRQIQSLLKYVAGQYRLSELLTAAVEAAPNNKRLKAAAEAVAQYSAVVPRILPRQGDGDAIGKLERILFKNVGYQNVRLWLVKLDRLTRAVCRIEPQPRDEGINGYGTGFLIGPDVILTNDHVASGPDGISGFWGK